MKHMESHDKDGDWTCGDLECSYQTITEESLKQPQKVAHPHPKVPREESEDINKQTSDKGPNKKSENSQNSCNKCGKNLVFKIPSLLQMWNLFQNYA